MKVQLQASWLMSQAGPASQMQEWNPLQMLTGAGTAGTGTGVEAVGTGDNCSSEVGPRECAAYQELEWDGPLSHASRPLLLVLG